MDLKNIKINGRYYIENDELWLFNTGSGISFRAKGAGFTVILRSLIQHCYYYLLIDRDYKNKIKLCTADSNKYQYLFNDDKPHFVDIVKSSEAKDNVLVISDLSINGELLEYDHKYDKNVMVYGDSTIAGYGILSHTVASLDTSDGVMDFAYRALYELNYEMDIVCASGTGLSFSAYTTPKTVGIYDYISNVAFNYDYSWNNKTKHDILIISLGCNDASYIEEQPLRKEECTKIFIKKYQNLIDSEIKLNKNIKILMVYGTLKEEQAYSLVEETYKCLKPLYNNLYIHKFAGDKSGAANHAYVTFHEKMAEEFKQILKEISI